MVLEGGATGTLRVRVETVQGRRELSEFIGLPWKIHRNDPNWVPPLRSAVRDLLDTRKNPFFKHAQSVLFVAWDVETGEAVGRIGGFVDRRHNEFHSENTAFFGFFETKGDPAIARSLFDEVKGWARAQGMTTLRGPMNPSTNHECGLLIEGFDDPPAVMMTQNPKAYPVQVEANGFTKSKDLYAYEIDHQTAKSIREMAQRQVRLAAGAGVTIRAVDMRKFDREIETIHSIYNDAWEKNWGFVPMDEAEFRHLAKDMKAIVDPQMLLIVEVAGKPAGFGLALPDVNRALRKVRSGRLTPFNVAKLLWNLKGPGRRTTIDRARVITLGIKQAYRPLGLGPLLYLEYLRRGPKLGYPKAECSWILEDNEPMNQGLVKMGAKRTKVYRIYDCPI